MRELKFRAWDSNNDEMVYSSQEDCFYVNTKGVLFMYKNVKREQYVKDYNVMQYTGLLDKNGVEIYEGDIMSGVDAGSGDKYTDLVVKFEDGMFCTDGYYLCESEISHSQFKVIGNIYENKELLND